MGMGGSKTPLLTEPLFELAALWGALDSPVTMAEPKE